MILFIDNDYLLALTFFNYLLLFLFNNGVL